MNHQHLKAVFCFLCFIFFCSCTETPGAGAHQESPEETGLLKALTLNASTTYHLDRHGQAAGPEYDLVTAFAQAQGWQVSWKTVETIAQVLQALEAGKAHLAASGLTHLDLRDQSFNRGPVHSKITQQLVCHRELDPLPSGPEELSRLTLRVTADSSYAKRLEQLREKYPDLDFVQENMSTERLLGIVHDKKTVCTVADSNIVKINRRFMPELQVVMDLTPAQHIGWDFAQGLEGPAALAREWMDSEAGQTELNEKNKRYYSYISEFDYVDLRALNRRIEDRLPGFKEYFLQAETETGLPADLLAAVAYQESHWDPSARSATGVRGIMMLTQNTAKSLGVTDRLDPVQSIEAGALYLADLHRRLPEDIPEPDRTYLALASYNIGRAHVLDARQLARELGKDPDSWSDVREVLPLLTDTRYYSGLKYGYARGWQPVHYVDRIRSYLDVIAGSF